MIKYFVRTTGERVLDDSFSQIEYELLVDTEGHCGKAFLKQLEYVKDYDAVLLEDDIILCKNFKERIEKVISEHPNDVINFFTLPTWYFKTRKLSDFSYNQCTYFPKGSADKLLPYADKGEPLKSAEKYMKRMLKLSKTLHIQYRPCLVQHLDNGSLMNHNCKFSRRSPYFVDYLEELGISYEDAVKVENQVKLRNLMKEKFKEIDSK